MKTLQRSFAAILLALAIKSAHASSIQVLPLHQAGAVGQLIVADLRASGLGSGSSPSIGAYDVSIGFDPSVLSFLGVTFGKGLDVSGFGSIQSVTPEYGLVEILEISLDDAGDLDRLQPDAFTLASLEFEAIGNGTSGLHLTANAISDADGEDLPSTLQDGSVQIGSSMPVAVTPEPPAPLLVATGLSLLAVSRKRLVRICREP